MECFGSKPKDADLWILIWDEVRRVHQGGISQEVDHVKAHRTKNQKNPRNSALQGMKERMRWQNMSNEEWWEDGPDQGKAQSSKKKNRMKFTRHCSTRLALTVYDCEELEPKPREK